MYTFCSIVIAAMLGLFLGSALGIIGVLLALPVGVICGYVGATLDQGNY